MWATLTSVDGFANLIKFYYRCVSVNGLNVIQLFPFVIILIYN